MKVFFKWILRLVISVVILVILAAIILPLVIDPNDYKDTIENKIAEQIGRKAHIDGDIEWSVFPWLALTFNDLKVDNEKGFKNKNIAEIQQLSARIKLLPLLYKEIQIGKIIIDGAAIQLQVAANGKNNWQSMVDNLDSDEKSSAEPSEANFNIEGIEIDNVSLSYIDAQAGSNAKITKLMLSSGEISPDSEVNIESSMHLSLPDDGTDIDINASMLAKDLFADSGAIYTLNDLNISGYLDSGKKIPLTISANKSVSINFQNDSISSYEMTVTAGDADIEIHGEAKGLSKDMVIAGEYQVSPFNLNHFIMDLSGSGIVNSDALDEFSSSGKYKLRGNQLALDQIKIKFDKSQLNGNVNIKNLDDINGSFSLDIDQLDVDKFLGGEDSASSQENSPATDLNFGNLNGSVKIGTLTASGTKMNNIDLKVTTNGSKMLLKPIHADFYEGLLVTSVSVDSKAKSNKVIVEHKMEKIHAGPLLTDLSGSQLLTGIGNLNVDLKIDEPFSEVPFKTAHGSIDYRLGDGAIYGIDVFGMMQKGLSLLYPETKQEDDNGEKKTTFAMMEVTAGIDKGIIKTKTLKVESPYLQITGDLTINLVNMTIDGTIEPVLLDIPEQLVSDKYKKLLNMPFPVSLSGSLLEPKVFIDPKKLILATQQQRIDQEKEKLKGKLLDSIFGKKKKDEDKSGSGN